MVGLSWVRRKLGGITARCKASEAARTPANPTVPSVWLITVLMSPTNRTSPSSLIHTSGPKKALLIASASTGLPACVPMPCAWKNWQRSCYSSDQGQLSPKYHRSNSSVRLHQKQLCLWSSHSHLLTPVSRMTHSKWPLSSRAAPRVFIAIATIPSPGRDINIDIPHP